MKAQDGKILEIEKKGDTDIAFFVEELNDLPRLNTLHIYKMPEPPFFVRHTAH